jgi:PIN domain nuclease of toxin-antitoxin system
MGDAALILADTQALVWHIGGSDRLGRAARQVIATALLDDELIVCAISFCEIAWLHHTGRVALPRSPTTWRETVLAEGVREIPVDGDIAIAASELEGFHKDPADRLIVATAVHERAILVTSDRQILEWTGDLQRIDARH